MKTNKTLTRGIFHCRDGAEISSRGSLETSLRLDSDVLQNRQQKHTTNVNHNYKNMKHFSLLLTILIFALQNYSQDYISYYNSCNQAEKQIYLEQYDSALISFDNGFQFVKYIHKDYLKKASLCAAKMGDLKTTHKFVVKAIKNGAEIDFYNNKDYKRYRKTKLYKTYQDSLTELNKYFLSTLQTDFIKIIDSLYYVDQKIIRGNHPLKGKYDLSKIEIPENKFQLDSNNLVLLLAQIDKYGFPSEKLVGKKSAMHANIILHHNLRQPQNNDLLIDFKKYIFTGEYLPSDYAWTFDQSFWFYEKEPVYYYGVSDYNKLTKEEIKKIDSLRYELGLKPTEATQIIKDSHSISYSPIW